MFVDTTKLQLSEARQIEFVNRYFREPQGHRDKAQGFVRCARLLPIIEYEVLDKPMY